MGEPPASTQNRRLTVALSAKSFCFYSCRPQQWADGYFPLSLEGLGHISPYLTQVANSRWG